MMIMEDDDDDYDAAASDGNDWMDGRCRNECLKLNELQMESTSPPHEKMLWMKAPSALAQITSKVLQTFPSLPSFTFQE